MSFEAMFFLGAAVASAATFGAHVVLGGRLFARPLLASTLGAAAKYTVYYCWHLVSAALAAMTVAFALTAFVPEARAAAWMSVVLAALFVIVNVSQNVLMGLPFARHPQGAFFLAVTGLGAAGLACG